MSLHNGRQAQEKVLDEQPILRNLVSIEDATEPSGREGSAFVIHTPNPSILCTGFEGSVTATASHLFEFADAKVDDEEEDVEEVVVEENDGCEVVQMDENDNEVLHTRSVKNQHI